MLTHYGTPFLRWLDEDLLVRVHDEFHSFWNYVRKFREVLEV